MRKRNVGLIVVVVLGALGVSGLQYQSTRRVAADLAALRQELAATSSQPANDSDVAQPVRYRAASSGNLHERLSALEASVAQLTRASEYLMDRGQLPLSASKVEDLFSKLTDSSASARDRLQALRQLRRNRAFTDEALVHTLSWLQTATNGGLREDILEQLEGLTNAALRGPLLALATSDPNRDVRERAIEGLRPFLNDPEVEAQLWQTVSKETDGDIRDEAREAIIEGRMTDQRANALRERFANANSSVEERLVAWQALREAGQAVPEASTSLAQIAQSTHDPFERAKLFRAWDNAIETATANDAPLLPPLIEGLQDPNPIVRERAADALLDFNSVPEVQQWLRFVAENDADGAVRNQAMRVFGQRR